MVGFTGLEHEAFEAFKLLYGTFDLGRGLSDIELGDGCAGALPGICNVEGYSEVVVTRRNGFQLTEGEVV
jgi:hypothetical protein